MTKRQIILLLLLALAVRLAYHQLVPAFDGSYHNGSDSGKYIGAAQSILEYGEVVRFVDGSAQADFTRMPLYPHFVAAVFWLAGDGNLAAVTAVQAMVSAFTIFAIALIAGAINHRWMIPAGVLASFWPAFVVYTAWVLTDGLFIDFFAWGLCACVWAPKVRRPGWLLAAAGLAFGLALLTRPVLMFFPYLLIPVLTYLLVSRRGMSWLRALGLGLVPAAIMLAMLVPRLVATYEAYGSSVITTQSGKHALNLIYPCTRTAPDCDRAGIDRRSSELVAAGLAELTGQERQNPVIVDGVKRQVALALISEVPPRILALAVADSAVRSVVQTMLYEVGDQLNRDPQYFSAVPGFTMGERLANFTANIFDNPFMFIWAVAQIAVLLALPVQFIGLFAGLRNPAQRSIVVFLVVTAGYFLAVNVSFGNPKYGIPLNPVEIVLLIVGTQAILDWCWGRRQKA